MSLSSEEKESKKNEVSFSFVWLGSMEKKFNINKFSHFPQLISLTISLCHTNNHQRSSSFHTKTQIFLWKVRFLFFKTCHQPDSLTPSTPYMEKFSIARANLGEKQLPTSTLYSCLESLINQQHPFFRRMRLHESLIAPSIPVERYSGAAYPYVPMTLVDT